MSAEQLMADFLATEGAEEELSLEYPLCPELEDVPVTVQKHQFRMGTYIVKEGYPDAGEERIWANLSLQFLVDSDEAREAIKRDEVILFGSSIRISIKDGKLDPNNNQALARTLKVFGLTSTELSMQELFDSFTGTSAIGKITHRALENKEGAILDEEGNQRYGAEVSALGKP